MHQTQSTGKRCLKILAEQQAFRATGSEYSQRTEDARRRPPGKGPSDKRGHLEKQKKTKQKQDKWLEDIMALLEKKLRNDICIVIKCELKIALSFYLGNKLRELNPIRDRRKLMSKINKLRNM